MVDKTKSAIGLGLNAIGVAFASQAALLTGTYTFPGADSQSPPSGDYMVPTQENMTYGVFSRVGGVTYSGARDLFSSEGWENTMYDSTRYVEFVLTPATGYSFDLTSLAFSHQKGANGPANGRVTMSYGTQSVSYDYLPSKSNPLTPLTWDFDNLSAGLNQAVTFRFYGWGAKGNAGNDVRLDFDDVAINGSITPVPEPVNVALGVFGLCVAGASVGRRVYARVRS